MNPRPYTIEFRRTSSQYKVVGPGVAIWFKRLAKAERARDRLNVAFNAGRAECAQEGELMGWASQHIAKLKAGESVTFRPRGRSMEPLIRDGQEVTVDPIKPDDVLEVGDVVLCTVRGNDYLHLIRDRDKVRTWFLIGNKRGGINGGIGLDAIYGRWRR